jgi:hypothetical protein
MSPRLQSPKVSVQEFHSESEQKSHKLLLRVIRDLWQLAREMEVLQTLWTSSLLTLRVLAWFPKIMLPLSLLFGSTFCLLEVANDVCRRSLNGYSLVRSESFSLASGWSQKVLLKFPEI